MKTECDFGREYAEWLYNHGEDTGVVDIDDMCNSTVDIPSDDYSTMVQVGIENPDPRKYWAGYNEFIAEIN